MIVFLESTLLDIDKISNNTWGKYVGILSENTNRVACILQHIIQESTSIMHCGFFARVDIKADDKPPLVPIDENGGQCSYCTTKNDICSPDYPGLCGTLGTKGYKGLLGEVGEKGDMGITRTGLQGRLGDKGIQGDRGQQPDKGSPGDRGDKGERGFKGLNGTLVKGEPGPKGDRGFSGAKGLRGLPGPIGQIGDTVYADVIDYRYDYFYLVANAILFILMIITTIVSIRL